MQSEQANDVLWTRPFLILLLMSLSGFASFYLLLPVMPVYVKQMGGTDTQTGAIFGIFSATALLVRPWAGWLSDRMGTRIVLLLGAFGLVAAAIAYVPTNSIGSVLFVRMLHGVGWGLFTAAAATLAAQLAPVSRRGTAISIYGMMGSIGLALGPILGTALGATPTGFLTAAATALMAFVLAAMLPRTGGSGTGGRPRLGALVSRSALLPAGILLAHMCTYGAVFGFIAILTKERGLGNSGWFFSVYAGALFLLRGVAGSLSDRFGRVKVIAPGLVLSAAGLAVLALSEHRFGLISSAILYAGATSALQPVALAWATDRSRPDERGAAISTVVAAQDLGISFGAFLAGFVSQWFGLTAVFLVSAAIALVGLIPVAVVASRSRAVSAEGADDQAAK